MDESTEYDRGKAHPHLEGNDHYDKRRRRKRMGGPPQQHSNSPIKKKNPYIFNDEDFIKDRLCEIREPIYDLEPICYKHIKFQSRNRLYITNIPNNTTESDLAELFKPYGDVEDIYINKNIFAFIRLDYFYNAVKAKHELNNFVWKDKRIKIHHSLASSIIVKNLPPYVSNELMHIAFSVFGKIDYCAVLTDKSGQSLNEAVIDFNMKRSAKLAKKYCNENYYLLNSYMRPVFVEDCETPYHTQGLSEDMIKKTREYYQSRDKGPRFAVPNTFEFSFATRYKDIYISFEMKKKELERMLDEEERALEEEVLEAKFDFETEQLKELLQEREREREFIKRRREGLPPENERDWNERRGSWKDTEGPSFSVSNENERWSPRPETNRREGARKIAGAPKQQKPPEQFKKELPENNHANETNNKKSTREMELPPPTPPVISGADFINPEEGFYKNDKLFERRKDFPNPERAHSSKDHFRDEHNRGGGPPNRFRERDSRNYQRQQGSERFNNSNRRTLLPSPMSSSRRGRR